MIVRKAPIPTGTPTFGPSTCSRTFRVRNHRPVSPNARVRAPTVICTASSTQRAGASAVHVASIVGKNLSNGDSFDSFDSAETLETTLETSGGVGGNASTLWDRLDRLLSDILPSSDGDDPELHTLANILSGSPVLAAVGDGPRTLFVQANGNLTFVDSTGDRNEVVSEALLTLPRVCVEDNDVEVAVEKREMVGGRDRDREREEVLVRWGPKERPLALLHVVPHGSGDGLGDGDGEWTKNMDRGFAVEFEVASGAVEGVEGAEICVRLATSGHWFGGGHFIRQIWPLNDASLEVGPWYAFDNGPNGVNNLLGAHWMTSRGLLVSVDPSQQYLHIGMNAPIIPPIDQIKKLSRHLKKFKRKWGVGIQNATRELLPLTKLHGKIARAGQDGLLRIQARSNYVDASMEHPLKHWQHEYNVNDDDMLSVRVSMSRAANATEACRMALGSMTPPKQIPDASVFKYPIWTTWARYKARVNQEKVLKYAREISDRCLPRSVMEIDDRWQVSYGDLRFDPKKFPDPVGMVEELHAMGFKVTTWVHPFVQKESAAYLEGAERGYFVGCDMAGMEEGTMWSQFWSHFFRWDWLFGTSTGSSEAIKYNSFSTAPGGSKVGFFRWWNTPPVAALDVTNPEAVEWFVARLRKLQAETGVDGFKFDAGEPCFLPRFPRTHQPLSTPAEYTQLYVERVAGQFAGGVSEVRTAHRNHDVAIMYRMGDRFSTWDSANGLRSLIPTLLTSGVLGYPFCLPDMIGGNAYFNTHPDKELMVRWTQVNALMPAMQFSLAPWDLGRETEVLVTKAISIRRKLEDHLVALAEEAAENLTPICRPLWMIAPEEADTYEIQDQFALGNDIIVAPVVRRGAVRRAALEPSFCRLCCCGLHATTAASAAATNRRYRRYRRYRCVAAA